MCEVSQTHRRFLLKSLLSFIAAAAIAPALVAGPVFAQDYPEKPINWIVPSSAGSQFDVLSRLITPKMSEALGQPIVIQNITGAGATIGAQVASEAAPDGYTLLLINANHPAGEALYPDLKYDLIESFDPVVRFTESYHVIVVQKDLEVASLADLLKLAKDKPGELNIAHAGVGSVTFMCAEIFKAEAGVDMVSIPYGGGGPAIAAVVSGETEVYGAPYATAKPFIDSGEVKALAMTSKERAQFAPDIPAVAETIPGFEFASFYGLVAPKGTPADVREKVRAALNTAVADESVSSKLGELGFEIIDEGPEEFTAFLKQEIEKTAAIVEKTGIGPQ